MFVTLDIQHAIRVRRVTLSLACPLISYTERFLKEMLLNIKCVFGFSLQLLSETFFTLRKTERNRNENVYWSSLNVLFISHGRF